MICYDSRNKNMNKQTLVCEKKNQHSSGPVWTKINMLHSARTSVDMDGTLKFVNYKVGGTQNPYSFTETKLKKKYENLIFFIPL